jgi:uncharacterized protein YebE (UPF0316 family)
MTITIDILTGAAVIFGLRVLNNAIGTVRLIMLSRQRPLLTFGLGFIESLIFALTFAGVIADLSNIPNLLAYCGGFAVGTYVGMAIEARFITSYLIVNIFAKQNGHDMAVLLRKAGFGVTETIGEGRDGKVILLRSVTDRRHLGRLRDIVQQVHPEAFIAVEEARSVERGWVRLPRSNQQEEG